MRAVRFELWAEFARRWRTWLTLALAAGVLGGLVAAALAAASRTDSVVARYRVWSLATDVIVGNGADFAKSRRTARSGSGPRTHPKAPAGRRGHEGHAGGQSASRARRQERHALRQRRGEPGCARRRGDRPVEAARRPAPGSASPDGGHGRRRRAVDAGDRARRHVLGARLSREGLEARSAHRGADRRRAPRPAEQRHAAVRHGVSGLLPGLRQPGARALRAAQCDQGPVAPWIRRRSRVPARGREHRGRPRLPVHRRGRRGRKAPVRLPRPGAGALARRRARGRSRRASCSRRGSRGRSSWSRSATGPCSPSG